MRYVQDYRIHLIDQAKLTKVNLKKFTSGLWEVIDYIKDSKDKENLSRILKNHSRMIDREAALVIKTITNTAIEISENEEEIDMCKAIDAMLNESRTKRRAEGKAEGQAEILVKQVKKGRLTIEEAAEDAGMTVEFFTIYKNCMCIVKNFLFQINRFKVNTRSNTKFDTKNYESKLVHRINY